MSPITVSEIAQAIGGSVLSGNPEGLVSGGVTTDSRNVPAGSLFVALVGDKFDGHDFAAKAVKQGAAAVLVSKNSVKFVEGMDCENAALIFVPDTLVGLQRLAAWWRLQLQQIRVVGITGSNGKTSTKDFTLAVLEQKYKVTATSGNLNNHIGLPISVLKTNVDDEVAVWEMGMNHAGEIAPLVAISKPEIGVITSIGTAHMGFLGSREAIAEEKTMLVRDLPASGKCLFTATCEYSDYIKQRTKATIIVVGNGRGSIRAENLKQEGIGTKFTLVADGFGTAEVLLPAVGKHMVSNSLLAAGVGFSLGMSIEEVAKGLNSAKLTSGRLRKFDCQGVTIFDDTYNANPESMIAAIDTLAETPVSLGNQRVVILGRMGELGEFSNLGHASVGSHASSRKIDRIFAVGEGAEGIYEAAKNAGGNAQFIETIEKAVEILKQEIRAGDLLLFKGSRSAGMEQIMNQAFPKP